MFVLWWSAWSFAQDDAGVLSLEVKGNTAINQSDIAGTRDRAIRDGLQKAIQEAASALLSIPVNDKKFLPVKKALIGEQHKFINNYKIMAEGQKDGNYFVLVNVAIGLLDLKNHLAKLNFQRISGEEKNNIIIFLEVKGLKNYSDFIFLREFLKKQTKMVKNIRSRSFQWQQVHLELEISDTVQALAVELAKTGRYLLNAELIKKNQIVISLLHQEGE